MPVTRRPLLDGAGGIGGQCGGEAGGVLAFLSQPPEPLPGQGDHVGDEVGTLVRALHAPEVDAAVPLDTRQDGEEASVQGVEGGSGCDGHTGMCT